MLAGKLWRSGADGSAELTNEMQLVLRRANVSRLKITEKSPGDWAGASGVEIGAARAPISPA
jgi:hypothetical protein